jgi:hypothetical protein
MTSSPSASPSRFNSILSVIGSVLALGAGRLLGWAFGLQFVLPLGAALVTAAVARRRFPPAAQVLVAGAAAVAADLTWDLLSFALTTVQYGFHLGPVSALIWLVHIGGFVWLMVRPGLPAAGGLALLTAYTVVMNLVGVPQLIRAMSEGFRVTMFINVFIPFVLATVALGFLSRGLMAASRVRTA